MRSTCIYNLVHDDELLQVWEAVYESLTSYIRSSGDPELLITNNVIDILTCKPYGEVTRQGKG